MDFDDLPVDLMLDLDESSLPQHSPEEPSGDKTPWLPILLASVCLSFVTVIGVAVYRHFPGTRANVSMTPPDETAPSVALPGTSVASGNWGPRKKIEDEWIRSTIKYANKSGSAKLKRVAQLVADNVVVATPRPTEDKIELLEAPRGPADKMVAFVPLMKGDNLISPYWKNDYEGSDGLAFMESSSTVTLFGQRLSVQYFIVVRSQESWSELGKAFITLHEGTHYNDNLEGKLPMGTRTGYCESERHAQESGLLLFNALYPETFRNLARQQTQQLQTIFDQGGVAALAASSMSTAPELETLLGPSESDSEKTSRQTSLWIQACYLIIEQAYPSGADKKKSEFYAEWIGPDYDRKQR